MAVTNISGAFIHTDMVHGEPIVRVRLYGVLSNLLVKIDLENFSEKVFLEGEQKVIYEDLNKDLYGALIASLLLWQDMSGTLRSWGFESNPYESCIMKNMVDGKQCTIF